MGKLLQHRRLHSLIVSMAILLNLFAPAIGKAVTSLSPETLLLEMCSAATPAPAKQQAHAGKHCAFCATHLDSYAPPPHAAGLQAVLRGHDAYPTLHAAVPAPRPLWSSAQPRGPPALS
ncbi:DUF2946 family protein [Duganella aceris]|uniref:DUF2946 domain-containing protein n=1 Tax=Duganella aceris TaxID=2703883 RepID=A0ABX0FJ38_9BURK|nr:DUF2946 family protein [Duganella aceris]NGZ84557.1 DUF2946 domain-containing protein [Duganella aceris]